MTTLKQILSVHRAHGISAAADALEACLSDAQWEALHEESAAQGIEPRVLLVQMLERALAASAQTIERPN